MVDVTEGDCYVVNLFESSALDQADSDRSKWKRLLIDTDSDVVNHRETIKAALCEVSRIDTWPRTDMIRVPPLTGVIVSHSDRDHSGNAHKLLKDLAKSAEVTMSLIDLPPPQWH